MKIIFRRKAAQPESVPQEYTKLYKKLAPNNQNKDVRIQAQGFLDTYIENQISPTLWMQINSNYRLENKMTSTENRDTHTGAKHEVTDKVYFIKKDEMTNYAEAKFKSAILMTKK